MKSEKITTHRVPPPVKSYDDACGTAHALELVGERWALLVMRELMLGPKRFSDLRADLPAISANVLTQRLEALEARGILRRRRLASPGAAQVYELTEWGYEAEPIVQTMGRWAARSPGHDPAAPISATSILLSFRTMLDREAARDMEARIGFDFGTDRFLGRLSAGDLTYERGTVEHAEATFSGKPAGIAAFVYGGAPPDALAQSGLLTIAGDLSLAERFAGLFRLPPKAELPAPGATIIPPACRAPASPDRPR
ncbi:winged helix-turn-helix transcriptional regulator [Enterovirga rhinocerotis]|uniref:HxlR family transcriptional regulator n=1 Tax=Enterovirga rhinocerotis TaxID=1339210 RepID=A0A4R7CA21_9HYPH|nr:winged helix-turn-helix transcriptional regulator [Enterovirga rhinocerotis]TDR94912.1 HxlR family transcriptional regulator [Enterovirga rhinocerotis]